MLSPNAIKRRQATIGRHAVILDWGSGELMPKSTAQFREQFRARSLNYWGERAAQQARLTATGEALALGSRYPPAPRTE
jgi:hypothetical protein